MKLARHLPTVALLRPKSEAMAELVFPSALASTIRARLQSDAGSERLRAKDCSGAASDGASSKGGLGRQFRIVQSPEKDSANASIIYADYFRDRTLGSRRA